MFYAVYRYRIKTRSDGNVRPILLPCGETARMFSIYNSASHILRDGGGDVGRYSEAGEDSDRTDGEDTGALWIYSSAVLLGECWAGSRQKYSAG